MREHCSSEKVCEDLFTGDTFREAVLPAVSSSFKCDPSWLYHSRSPLTYTLMRFLNGYFRNNGLVLEINLQYLA